VEVVAVPGGVPHDPAPALRSEREVEQRLIFPGTEVEADSVILELSNPQLELVLRDAQSQLRAAQARYTELKVQLQSQLLDQKAAAARVKARLQTIDSAALDSLCDAVQCGALDLEGAVRRLLAESVFADD